MKHGIALALIVMLGAGTGAAYGQEQPPWLTGGQQQGQQGQQVEAGVVRLTPDAIQKIKEALIQRGYTFRDTSGTTGTGQSPITPGAPSTTPSVPGTGTGTEVRLDDPELQAAVAKFQKDLALRNTGQVDLNTLDALGLEIGVGLASDVRGADQARFNGFDATTRPAGMPQQSQMVGGGRQLIGFVILDSTQVKSIQDRLKALGYYNGQVDGTFSQPFADAVRHFQDADGIRNVNGLIDMRTLAHFPQVNIAVKAAPAGPAGQQNPEVAPPRPGGVDPRNPGSVPPQNPPIVPGTTPQRPGTMPGNDPVNPTNPQNPPNPGVNPQNPGMPGTTPVNPPRPKIN